MSNNHQEAGNIASADPNRNSDLETSIHAMITKRLLMFHDALVARNQIMSVPKVHALMPKADVSEDANAA